jgi:hypothetical protein
MEKFELIATRSCCSGAFPTILRERLCNWFLDAWKFALLP